jgi:hypothetical protein
MKRTPCLLAGLSGALLGIPFAAHAAQSFANVTMSAGIVVTHGVDTLSTMPRMMASGAACGDYDGDGWHDLYYIGGNVGRNWLFRNNGDGTFTDVAVAAGVDLPGIVGAGACFADYDGDGDADLFVGSVEAPRGTLFRNEGDGTFTEVTGAAGLAFPHGAGTFSSTFGDLDGDGYPELFTAHWGDSVSAGTGHIWHNNGDGTFTDADAAYGYVGFPHDSGVDRTFAYNLADIDDDGDQDVLVASDFVTSHIFRNDGGVLVEITDPAVITDDNGMGSTIGDYDNDGDLDWFLTSVYSPPGKDGNKLYRNDGNGVFADVSAAAGIQLGLWGWGATFQDLDLDGYLDIFHVNGWQNGWTGNPSRLFRNDQDGTFTEISFSVGASHNGMGRGVCAFDYDHDGDVDLFLANHGQPPVLLRNDGLTSNWLAVRLVGQSPNTQGLGARILVTAGGSTQIREIRCGSNFLSQDSMDATFGLGVLTSADEVRVDWPDGAVSTLSSVSVNQYVTVVQPGGAVDAPLVAPDPSGLTLLRPAPNPFRDEARIRFVLPAAARTVVSIHDVTGRRLRTLSDGPLGDGPHAVSWDGRDEAGSRVASGVYLFVVRTPTETAEGRIVRLR